MSVSNPPPGSDPAPPDDTPANLGMLQRLVARSADGMVLVQDRIVRYDNQGLHLTPADDRIGHVFAERATPEVQAKILATVDAIQRGDLEEARVEWQSQVTGRFLEAILRSTEHDDRPAVVGYLRDVSQHKRLTETLAETVDDLALYRQIFELVRDNILLIQDDVVQLSNGALREPGAPSIVGRRLTSLMFPDAEGMEGDVRRLLDGEMLEARWEHRYPSQLPPGYRTMEAIGRHIEYRGRPALLVTTRDISERKATENRLREMTRTDSLTGIPNRRAFYEAVDYWRAEAARNRTSHAVCYIDLDRFKSVNDAFGHQAGDDLLVDIAERLRATVRRTDILARLGGDEFSVLLPATSADEAAHVAEKLIVQIDLAAASYPEVGASVGLTTFNSDEDPDQIMNRADREMYRIKMARRAKAS